MPGQSSRSVNWNCLGRLLTEPRAVFSEVYRWDSDFDTHLFLNRLEKRMRASILPGGIYPQSQAARAALGNASPNLPELRFPIFQKGLTPETYAQFGITFSPAEAQGGEEAGPRTFAVHHRRHRVRLRRLRPRPAHFESTADIRGVGIVVRPPLDAQGLMNLTGSFHAAIRVREKPDRAEEIIVVGTRGGTRLSLQGLGVSWFVDGAREKLDLGVRLRSMPCGWWLLAARATVSCRKCSPACAPKRRPLSGLACRCNSGFTFRGGGKLALDLGTHLDVGPVHVTGLRLAHRALGQKASRSTRARC